MIISVTGGSGFIGRRLVDVLCRQGHSVKMLSRHNTLQVVPGAHVEKGDLATKDCPLDEFVEKCDVVFHCAGEIRNEGLMRSLHVDATQRLIEAVLNEASKTGRVIHWVQLSSVGAYGPPSGKANSDRVVTEETDNRPIGEYEITKTISDDLVVQACESGLMTYSIVRPSNVFGENMTNQSLRGLGNMIRKRMFFYIGKPGAIATYVHIDDVVEVLLRCGIDPRARGGVFNISNDCLLEEMVNGIAIALSVTPPRIRLPENFVRVAVALVTKIYSIPLTQKRINALISRTRYPCDKLESELDYKPKIYVPGSIGEALFSQ